MSDPVFHESRVLGLVNQFLRFYPEEKLRIVLFVFLKKGGQFFFVRVIDQSSKLSQETKTSVLVCQKTVTFYILYI